MVTDFSRRIQSLKKIGLGAAMAVFAGFGMNAWAQDSGEQSVPGGQSTLSVNCDNDGFWDRVITGKFIRESEVCEILMSGDELRGDVLRQEEEIQSLVEESNELSADLEVTRRNLARTEVELEEASTRLEAVAVEFEACAGQRLALTDEASTLRANLDNSNATLGDQSAQLAASAQRIADLEALLQSNNDTLFQLDQANSSNAELQAQLDAAMAGSGLALWRWA